MKNKLVPNVIAWMSIIAVALAACAPANQSVPATASATVAVPTVVASPTGSATATAAVTPTAADTPTISATPTFPATPPSAGSPRSNGGAQAAPTVLPTATAVSFADPFAYCAVVGTVDKPDARYTGPQTSEVIFMGYLKAAGMDVSSDYPDAFKQNTIWRCMDKQVYACNFGANLPCDSKADTDKTPTQAMADFCKATPGSDFIPMAVTGHATIYSWHCVKDTPAVLDQIDKPDAAGYLTRIWYPIQAAAATTPTAPAGGSAAQLVFSSNRDGAYAGLYTMNLDGSGVTLQAKGDAHFFAGPWSPDGQKILYTGFGLVHSYVGVMNADGTGQTDLTQQPNSDEGFPAWSPDGHQIAFTSRRDGNNQIYVMNADGTHPARLTKTPGDDFAPAWSPDGKQIAFSSDRDRKSGVYSLYLIAADGSKVRRLTNAAGSDYAPAWSPDGTQIAFRSDLNGSSDIEVVSADGTGLHSLTSKQGANWAPVWSADGKQIIFQTNRDGNWEIYSMKADGSNPRNLTQNSADDQYPNVKP